MDLLAPPPPHTRRLSRNGPWDRLALRMAAPQHDKGPGRSIPVVCRPRSEKESAQQHPPAVSAQETGIIRVGVFKGLEGVMALRNTDPFARVVECGRGSWISGIARRRIIRRQ